MKMLFKKSRSNQGLAIVVIMIILIVATAIGVWALSSSRSSMNKASNRKFSTELTYQAEQALQKAVRRFQNIQANASMNQDKVAQANFDSAAPGKTGGDYAQKDRTFLINDICREGPGGCAGTTNEPCTNSDPLKDFDVINENVVCNFLGVEDPKTQVSIVRKDDLTAGSDVYAIYLVNSIATDSSGRKQGVQGVVVVPNDPTDPPRLANSKAITE